MDHFLSSQFDERINSLLEEVHLPGLAIAVLHDGVVKSKGYGCATINPPRPCTADTIFDIASSSKSLTAASVAQLVADDDNFPHVQWDSKMSALLPDAFVMAEQNYTRDITVEDILSHRTGLPSHDSSYLGIRAKEPDTAETVTRNLRNLRISEPIRTKFQYCNLMFTVATHLVEKLTKKTFSEFLKERFFVPLDMDRTYLQPAAARAAGFENCIATPYVWDEDAGQYTVVEEQQTPEAQGAGSIMTTVQDYIKYVRAVMDHQKTPFTPDVYKGLMRCRIVTDPDVGDAFRLAPYTSFTAYAAGWEIKYYLGHEIIGHDGLIPGSGSKHFFLPEFGFGCVILGNAEGIGEAVEILSMELIDEVIGVPREKRTDWSKEMKKRSDRFKAEEKEASVMKQLCPEGEEHQPLTTALGVYAGHYLNAGYHGMLVEVRDGKLFIDGSDRSGGVYLTFTHLKEQRVFLVELKDYFDGQTHELAAEFVFKGEKVVRMGLWLEEDLDDYIWFDRMEQDPVKISMG